jgi:hypothetical protein
MITQNQPGWHLTIIIKSGSFENTWHDHGRTATATSRSNKTAGAVKYQPINAGLYLDWEATVTSKKEAVRRVFDLCFPEAGTTDIDDLLEKDKGLKFAVDSLQADEVPERITPVSLELASALSSYGFLWSTSQRLLFSGIIKGFFTRTKPIFREYSYRSIADIQLVKGNLFREARIILHLSTTPASGDKAKVAFGSVVGNAKLQEFVDYIRDKIANPQAATSGVSSSVLAEGDDLVIKLEHLARLKSQGAITEQEFLAAKKKLLES